MKKAAQLSLYEEIILLALRNEKGTMKSGFANYAIAGGILAELLLRNKIALDESKKLIVDCLDQVPTKDKILDECLGKIGTSKRRGSLSTWISKTASTKELVHRVANQLCEKGILKAEKEKILLLFTQRVYPELDPIPEKELMDRLHSAIFSDDSPVDARTTILVALANTSNLLGENFGSKEIKSRKKRIDAIVEGNAIGKETQQVIQACQAAIVMVCILPAIM